MLNATGFSRESNSSRKIKITLIEIKVKLLQKRRQGQFCFPQLILEVYLLRRRKRRMIKPTHFELVCIKPGNYQVCTAPLPLLRDTRVKTLLLPSVSDLLYTAQFRFFDKQPYLVSVELFLPKTFV